MIEYFLLFCQQRVTHGMFTSDQNSSQWQSSTSDHETGYSELIQTVYRVVTIISINVIKNCF